MAIVSAYTIIRSLSLFHITVGVLFLRNPRLIADQNIVFLLGESMQLVSLVYDRCNAFKVFADARLQSTPREFLKPSPTTAFIAVLLAFLGISDLTSLSLADEAAEAYWGTQTPVRLTFLFGLVGYIHTFKEGGIFAKSGRQYAAGAGDSLKNSIMFTWGFLELSAWFWVGVPDRR